MDEQMKSVSNTEKTRRLQQLQEAASIEIKALKAEIQVTMDVDIFQRNDLRC